MSRGVVIFGINNEKVDYVRLAVMCAAFVKKNMPNTKTCLITDQNSITWQGDLVKQYFDDIVTISKTEQKFSNKRKYKDTQYFGFDDTFKNETRSSVYNLSPYTETLLIDCDFLVCNDVLSNVWDSQEEVMINKQAIDLTHKPLSGAEFRLNPFGIPMYWATVIYFRKGEKAERLFNLVEHIKDNWEFYQLVYDFPGHLFRNDYAFSIAIHILNGFVEDGDYVKSLPEDRILSALDTDQFFNISSPTNLSFFYQDKKETWKYFVSKTKGLNVHCMNKLSLLNHMDSIMEQLK